MKQELRCNNCNWHLANVDCPDSLDHRFSVDKDCPECGGKNTFIVIKYRKEKYET